MSIDMKIIFKNKRNVFFEKKRNDRGNFVFLSVLLDRWRYRIRTERRVRTNGN
jgi:hypothetical protein